MSRERGNGVGSFCVGVDLGGTNIRVAVFDDEMRPLERAEVLTEARQGAEAVIGRTAACVREVLERAGLSLEEIAGVGVGAAGLTNWETGIVLLASNLNWKDVLLRQRLGEELDGINVEVDKDTNAAALAEARMGAGKKFRDFLYVSAGTGIGGGLVLGGELYRGATGGAGDLGHVVVDPDGPRCGCGGYGCVEVFASGAGMVDRAKEILNGVDKKAGSSTLEPEELTTEDIFVAARGGDAVAAEVVERAGSALGLALADYVNLNNPEGIVLGGGVARAGDIYRGPVERELKQRALPALAEVVELVPPELGDDVGLIGAALLIREPARYKNGGGS